MTWHHPVTLVMSRDLIRILQAILYFTDQHLAPFYRLFCKIANLGDIDLKFLESTSNVKIDSPAKLCEVSLPGCCIFKNWDFREFDL